MNGGLKTTSLRLNKLSFLQWKIGLLCMIIHLPGTIGQTVVEVIVGESVVLPCTLSCIGDLQWMGGPQIILVKVANGTQIIDNDIWQGGVSLVNNTDLQIKSVRQGRDELNFTCTCSATSKTQQTHIRVLIPLSRLQILKAEAKIVNLTAGSPSELTCRVGGNPTKPIYYSWKINGNHLNGGENTIILSANKTTKSVRCRAFNKYNNGTEFSSRNVTVTLNVLYLDDPQSPDVLSSVIENDTVTLHCLAQGNPPPSFEWLKSDIPESKLQNFTINRVNRSDDGQYTCNVSNAVGIKVTLINLSVKYPPVVNVTYNKATQALYCTAKGVPPVYNFTSWQHRLGGNVLQTFIGTPSTGSSTTLKLPDTLTYEDVGYYECYVSNGIKTPQAGQVFVNIPTRAIFSNQRPTVVENDFGRLTVSVSFYTYSSTPNISVIWTKDGVIQTSHTEEIGPVTLTIHNQSVTIDGNVTILKVNNTLSVKGNYTVTVTNYINNSFNSNMLAFDVGAGDIVTHSPGPPAPQTNILIPIAGGTSGFVLLVVVIVIIVVMVKRKSRNNPKLDTRNEGDIKSNIAFRGDEWKTPDAEITVNEVYTSVNGFET